MYHNDDVYITYGHTIIGIYKFVAHKFSGFFLFAQTHKWQNTMAIIIFHFHQTMVHFILLELLSLMIVSTDQYVISQNKQVVSRGR